FDFVFHYVHLSLFLSLYVLLFYLPRLFIVFFFFTAPSPTAIYTLSLHDALPICVHMSLRRPGARAVVLLRVWRHQPRWVCRRRSDRKSTRLNSSHGSISYAVFCLKKKKKKKSIMIHEKRSKKHPTEAELIRQRKL